MYAVDPAASGGGLHLRYEGVAGVTMSDDPQLPAVHLVRSEGSPALTGHYLVDRMHQPDLPSVEEHFVASGRHVLPLVGVTVLEPGDILGVAHAPLLSVPRDVLQQDNRAPSPPSVLSEVPSVSAVTASPSRRASLALACPAWVFEPRTARFVPARLGTFAVASAGGGF